ncbi:MAG: RHS repeat protein [Gemmatimonadetes bacterium]|nr:RHS repeat protein [Gemmatimonadota bacterium]
MALLHGKAVVRLVVVAGIALAGVLSFAASDSTVISSEGPRRGPQSRDLMRETAGLAAPLACSTSLSAITPCTQSATVFTNRVVNTQFTIQNKSIEPVSYILTCARTSAVATCSAPGALYVPKNSSKTVYLTWTTTRTTGTGTATLTADDGSTPVTGTVNATVSAPTPTYLYLAAVNPHLQRHEVDSGQADTARFVVRNGGADSTGWSYSVACAGSAIVGPTCSPSSGTVGLAAGASSTIAIAYTTGGAANASGTVKLTFSRTADATIRDSGTVEVVTTRRDSLVIVSDVNPGESVEPDQCVTASVGPGLAAECGDLRAAHTLPSLRTFNTVRAPVLLYHSRQAHPRPIVRADVTLPDTRIPDSVVATLLDSTSNAISGARGNWAGSQWRARSSRRIAVQFDGLSWPSGSHAYTFRVQRYYAGSVETNTAAGRFWIVNRSASPYGAGWWIAGLEHVAAIGGDLFWEGGDGATRRYASAGTNVWVAPSLDRPDTIVYTGSWYERRLPHGLKVHFDASSGLHKETVNRLGQVTRFVYVSGTSRLDSIVPPSGSSAVSWRFRYDGSNLLRAVDASFGSVTGRRDSVVINGSGDLTAIVQRDGSVIQFGYDGSEAHRIVTRTDPRGAQVGVSYATGSTIATVRLPRDTGATIYDTLRLTAAESREIATTTALPTGAASTIIDGMRTDVGDTTAFLVNRWGAPTRVRNALGDETLLQRTSGTFPTLATWMRAPNGRIVTATYDARGNIATVTDSATSKAGPVYATTSYTWNSFDFVTRVVMPEGDSTTRSYDAGNGNLLWAQDGRGDSTRTTFTYYASGTTVGLLARSLTKLGVKDSVVYDAALINVSQRLAPFSHYVTVTADAVGRLVRTQRPYDAGATRSRTPPCSRSWTATA